MEQPTCKTCKWWSKKMKLALSESSTPSHCGCQHLALTQDGDWSDGLWVDGLPLGYQLFSVFTGPNFGCIHHEPTDTTKGI